MPTLTERVNTAVTAIEAAKVVIVADQDTLHDIVHGPSTGDGSVVVTENGNVKTVARAIAEIGGAAAGGLTGEVDVTASPYNAAGDGVANDRTAIQAAIDAVAALGGGTVYLPAGIYRITQGLNLKSNVHLRGAGAGSIIRPQAGSMTAQTLAGIAVFASIAMVGVVNAKVSRLALDHATNGTVSNGILIGALVAGLSFNFSTTTTSGDPGSGLLRFNNATLGSVTAVYISETDALSAGVSASLGFTNGQALRFFSIADPRNWVSVTVSGSVTDNGAWRSFAVVVTGSSGSFAANDKIGIAPGVGATDPRSIGCTVEDCDITGTEQHEYLVWNLGGRSTRIVGNRITGKTTGIPSTDTPCIEIYGGDDVLVSDNVLRNANQGVSVFSVAGWPGSSCRDIVITGNTIESCYDGVLVSAALKTAAGGDVARVLIDGNTLTGCTNRGVVLSAGDSAAIDLARVSGNVSLGTPVGGHFLVNNNAAAVRSDVVIRGNTARTVTGTSWGYSITNGKGVSIAGNAARGTLYYGAIVSGGTGNRVVDNDFDGTITVGIQIDTDAIEVVASGNTLRGHTGYGIYADNTVDGLDLNYNHFDRASGGTEVEAILSTASNARATGNTLGYAATVASPVSVSGASVPVAVLKTLNLALASSPYHNIALPAADIVVLSGEAGDRVATGFVAGVPGQRVSIVCQLGGMTYNHLDASSSANNRLQNTPASLGNVVLSGPESVSHWLYVGGTTNKWVLEGSQPAQAAGLADGAVTTAKLANNAVTLAKLATIATGRFLGNVSGSSAVPAELTAAQVKTALAIASADVSGLATSATTDTTNASNISSGTLPAARLPVTTMLEQQPPTADTNAWIIPPMTNGTLTLAMIFNRKYMVPLVFTKPTTIRQIALHVTTAASGNIRLGLRNWDGTKATTLISDIGTVSCATTGLKTITGLSIDVPAGIVLAEFVSDVQPTILAGTSYGALALFGGSLANPMVPWTFMQRTFTYGALPADETGQTQTMQGNTNFPVIGVRTWT